MYYDFSNPKKRKPKPPKQKHPLDKKSKLFVFSAIVVLAISVLGGFVIAKFLHPSESTSESEELAPTSDQIEKSFDFAFLKLEPNNQNLIYSPLSIKNGLALLQAGANGDTKTQIEKILGDVSILNKSATIQDKLSLANAIIVRNSFQEDILNSYTATVKKNYNAEVIYDSFTNTESIDNWISQKTFGLIQKLPLALDESTQMVLVNTLAIQLDWLHQFEPSDTSGRSFITDNKEIVATTLFMTTKADDIKYFLDDKLTVLSLPLEPAGDARLEFVAIMPNQSLSDYLVNFDYSTIDSKLASATLASSVEEGVELHIPKFKLDYELAFKKDLIELGVSDAFDQNLADFSAISKKPLYVSDAIHKTNINLSEKGIEASAITASAMAVGSVLEPAESQPVVINIDHPFLFLIRDENNGTIWFLGTVYNPELWSGNDPGISENVNQ